MTSIVSLLAGPFVQQASDRLVTLKRGGITVPLDAAANKSLVLIAPDAAVAIGYTGVAFIDGRPTDSFLADHFAGHPVVRGALTVGRISPLRIGESVIGLLRRLEAATTVKSARGLAPTIMIAGWRWKVWRNNRRTDRGTFLWTIHLDPRGRYHFDRMPRPLVGTVRVSGVPRGRLIQTEVDAYLDDLQADATHSKERAEVWLAELVRKVAARARAAGDPTVGDDVMVITIPPPHFDRVIRVRYIPMPGTASSSRFGGYTPWVIGPGVVLAPSEATSGLRLAAGPFQVQIIGPAAPKGGMGLAAQPRPGPP